MRRILAVDGNSLGHRAWHALRHDARADRPWVARGVVRMLATAWRHGPFHGVVVAFDASGSRRRQLHPGYKANRDEHDPALHTQFDRAAQLLSDCGFTVVHEDGCEADDLLATAADECRTAGARCVLLSSDRDLIALVDDHVTLLRPRRTMSDLEVLDPRAVQRRYGIPPSRYIELAALRGDPSDNLPGVRGIGAKTAAKLLASWGSIDALYEGLRDLPPSVADALRAARPAVERNLELMAPLPGRPVGVAATLERGIDLDRIHDALAAVGLSRTADHLRRAVQRGPQPPLAPPPTDTSGFTAEPVTRRPLPPRPAASATQVSLF